MRLWIRVVIFACFLLEAFSHPQERARAEFDYEGNTIVLEAEQLTRQSDDFWIADGDVVITYQDIVLRAPRLTYNLSTGEVVVREGLEITEGLQRLQGTQAELNLKMNTGSIYNAEGFTDDELYVKAKKLLKTGPNTYVVQNGFLTACEEAVPKWSFTIKEAHLKTGGMVRVNHTLFKIKKIPVFYLPVMLFPTGEKKRSSGFLLPTIGNSNDKGRSVSQALYLVLGRSADITLRGDYFSKRGFGQGLTFRTRPNALTSLELDWYSVKDRKNQGGTTLTGIGETRLPHGFRVVADFNLVSSFVFRQVFSDNFYTATLPTDNSRVFLSNTSGSRSFNLIVSREETVFPGQNVVIRNTPSLNFKLTGENFFNAPLYFDLDASAEGRSRTRLFASTHHTSQDNFFETPGIIQRLDLFPQFYSSFPLFQGLRITPRLGLRETFYSDSLHDSIKSTDSPLSGNNIHRQYAEFTLDLQGWGLSKIYKTASGKLWKHLIEPTFQYHYVGGVKDFDRILRFDEVDAIANTNEVEYAIWNRLFVKTDTEHGEITREWLSVKLAQKIFFDSNFGGAFAPGAVNQFYPLNTLTGFPYGTTERTYSPLTTLVRLTPQPRYSFDIRGDYDPRFGVFRNFSVTGFLSRPGIYLGGTYFVTKTSPDLVEITNNSPLASDIFQSNQLQAQIAIGNPQRGLSIASNFSYDVRAERFLSYRSRVDYSWDCCGFAVEYQGFNLGIRQEKQLRFSIFLKGIGTFGTIQQPDLNSKF
ncbi:MAG: putative LPS assembly protein LptD [Acidobacteriota bacterium]|nr:putative LPS assembly protein LptD [Acidobacteriota bacterium]